MRSDKATDKIRRVYDQVHLALWAILLAGIVWFAIFVVPTMPQARARWEAQRAHKIAEEHEFYCNKFGMGAGTRAHDACILDLQAFRTKVEQRLVEENSN